MWKRRFRSGSRTDVATAFWRTMPRRHSGSGRRRNKGMLRRSSTSGSTTAKAVASRTTIPKRSDGIDWRRNKVTQTHRTTLGACTPAVMVSPPNGTEAVRWWQLAAEQGHAVAQFNLGFMYGNGLGVPQDYTEAVQRYRRAAERGLARARNRLGFVHRDERTVPQDYVLAHMWLNLAASHATGALRDGAIQGRDRAAQEMPPDQLAEAQRLALEWKPVDER